MSLDKNLFTLHFTQHKENPAVVDLVDPSSGTIHYRKQRVPSPEYNIEVYDPMSESLLAKATAPSPTSKLKVLELCNPTSLVELKYTGTLSFKWAFKWEEHDYEWKREECFMIRKPDPPVIVAVTKETTGRLKSTSVQILDYNLNRFDIDDRKGLEIVILTALLTFQDYNEAVHNPDSSTLAAPSNPGRSSSVLGGASSPSVAPPQPPPKPAPKTGIDRIAELQAMKGEYNEIIISEEGNVQDYAEYCNTLLQDDAMLFITVKSSEAEHVPKVLQVVEETKRIRHKAGLSEEEELHQYVLYDTQDQKKGPRRINLDDEAKNKYAPPKNLTVHLSKISMPELQPKGHVKDKSSRDHKKKGDKQVITAKPARPAPPAPVTSTKPSGNSSSKPPVNKLLRPGKPSSPNQHVHAHQVHPNQPSPSPSQINNPAIYSAPPPRNYSSRPTSSQGPRPPVTTAPSFPEPYAGMTSPAGSYGSHAPTSGGGAPSASYPSGQNPTFPPMNWSSPTAPSQIHQPQPINATQNPIAPSGLKPASTSVASTVVHGLMDKLLTRR